MRVSSCQGSPSFVILLATFENKSPQMGSVTANLPTNIKDFKGLTQAES